MTHPEDEIIKAMLKAASRHVPIMKTIESVAMHKALRAALAVARPLIERQVREQAARLLPTYDAGLLASYGGGDVHWWQDYLRAELGRAHEFYVVAISPEATP